MSILLELARWASAPARLASGADVSLVQDGFMEGEPDGRNVMDGAVPCERESAAAPEATLEGAERESSSSAVGTGVPGADRIDRRVVEAVHENPPAVHGRGGSKRTDAAESRVGPKPEEVATAFGVREARHARHPRASVSDVEIPNVPAAPAESAATGTREKEPRVRGGGHLSADAFHGAVSGASPASSFLPPRRVREDASPVGQEVRCRGGGGAHPNVREKAPVADVPEGGSGDVAEGEASKPDDEPGASVPAVEREVCHSGGADVDDAAVTGRTDRLPAGSHARAESSIRAVYGTPADAADPVALPERDIRSRETTVTEERMPVVRIGPVQVLVETPADGLRGASGSASPSDPESLNTPFGIRGM